MATSNLSMTVRDSEEVYEFTCTACSLDDVTRRALYQCVDCDARYCATCMKDHNKLPNLRSHQVLDEAAMKKHSTDTQSTSNLPTERCQEHHGKIVDMFCVGHDQVCCSACIAVHHRSCDKVEYIPSIANGTGRCKELRDMLTNAKTQRLEIQCASDSRKTTLKSLANEEREIIKQVDAYKDKMMKEVERLANASKEQVRGRYTELKTTVDTEKKRLDMSLKEIDEAVKGLETRPTANESQTFVIMKQLKGSMPNYRKLSMFLGSQSSKLECVLNNRTLYGLEKDESFVDVIRNKLVTLSLQKTINVKEKSDSYECDIADMLELENGHIVISDYRNKKLKLLDGSWAIQSHVDLESNPMCLCSISPKEIAVSMREKSKIQFVSTGQPMSLTSSFLTPRKCTGIYYDETMDNLYVCCGGKWIGSVDANVQVFSKKGELKKTIHKDSPGNDLFNGPVRISLVSNDTLVIADRVNGLVALDASGNKKWTFTDASIKDPWSVREIPGGQILVVGLGSRNVHQMTKAGVGIGEVLSSTDLKATPNCMHFDRINSQLVVGGNVDELKIFSIKF